MTDDLHPTRKRGLLGALRASFLTGLVVVLPVGLTIYLIWTVIGWIDGWMLPLIPSAWQPDALVKDAVRPRYAIPACAAWACWSSWSSPSSSAGSPRA